MDELRDLIEICSEEFYGSEKYLEHEKEEI